MTHAAATVQVAVKPNLFFENGYEYNPPGTPKAPTASQVCHHPLKAPVHMRTHSGGVAMPCPYCSLAQRMAPSCDPKSHA